MTELLVRELAQRQNADGGWSYRTGRSATEPTCYAILSLQAGDGSRAACERGRDWLLGHQRADGGWAPEPLVNQSTWVTSLAMLALDAVRKPSPEARASIPVAQGIHWLQAQIGRSSRIDRLRQWLFGPDSPTPESAGWSWFPGTAAWVTPTVMAIVALTKTRALAGHPEIGTRVAEGRQFLLSRRCADAGWNYGGTFLRSEAAPSYPETTGMALIGLQNISGAALDPSLRLAGSLLARAGSVEGLSWLQIALAAHGRSARTPGATYQCWTNIDRALQLMAAAAQEGRNMFSLAQS